MAGIHVKELAMNQVAFHRETTILTHHSAFLLIHKISQLHMYSNKSEFMLVILYNNIYGCVGLAIAKYVVDTATHFRLTQ